MALRLRRDAHVLYDDEESVQRKQQKTQGNYRTLTEEWIKENPDVYLMFVRFARQMVEAKRNFGINLLRERVRWECKYEYDDDMFKFCNSFSPYIARHMIAQYPEFAPYIRCRATKY